MNRIRVIVLLVVLALCGGWFAYKKWPRRPPPDPKMVAAEQERKRAEERAAKVKEHSDAIGEARARDAEAMVKKWQDSPEAKAYEEFIRRRKLSETHRFPLDETAELLSGTLALPARRSPVLYLAPLYGANGDATTATEVLESMIRFYLRPSLPGATPVNLVPSSSIMLPYSRANDTCEYRNRKPDQYVHDARQIGADLFAYGRADVAQGNVLVQLVCVDMATSRSETFSVNVPVDRIGEVVAQTVAAVTKFAGIDDAALAAAGLKASPDALPTHAAFEAVVSAPDTADSTSTRERIASAGPNCPWLHQTLAWGVTDDPVIDLANETLRKFPTDSRMLSLKSRALSVANDTYAAAVLSSELVRRQPDNLVAVRQLATALDDTVRTEDYSPRPNPMCYGAYRSAMDHVSRLLERYPNDWSLHWIRSVLSGYTMFTASTGFIYDAIAAGRDSGDLSAADYDAVTSQCARLGEQALADLRKAIDLKPDAPNLMTALIYWHYHLTDHQGEDSPEKSILWQYPLLARIHLLDPQNVEADLNVALMQGYADGDTHVKILEDAAKRTNRNPKVMLRIASNLAGPLRRRMKYRWDDSNEVKKQNAVTYLTAAPEVPLFTEALTIAAEADEPLYQNQASLAWCMQYIGPPANILWSKVYNYKNGHWKGANAAMEERNWEECLKHAYRARYLVSGGEQERMQYCVVKSLWKLGRLRRALYEAEYGINWFPRRHTFHYLFAIVALELNDRLEEAYERAKLAAELDPENQGCKDTAEKIGKRLGK